MGSNGRDRRTEEDALAHLKRAYVGYRRLYECVGCSLRDERPLRMRCEVPEGRHLDLYVGPHPTYGVTVSHVDGAVGIEEAGTIDVRHYGDPTDPGYPVGIYAETVVWERVQAPSGHAEARDQLSEYERTKAPAFQRIADLVSGIFGLFLHPQLVGRHIDDRWLLDNTDQDQDHGLTVQAYSPPIRVIENPTLNAEPAHQRLDSLITSAISRGDKELSRCAWIMTWLVRAWSTEDQLSKFLSFFVPLEMILSGVKVEMGGTEARDTIRSLVRAHAGDDTENLLQYFNSLADRRPPLTDRFEALARRFALPGWEKDAVAFKRFNRIRNRLIHQGIPRADLFVSAGKEEVAALEDIAERYVARYVGQQSASVYDSRFRRENWSTRLAPLFHKADTQ